MRTPERESLFYEGLWIAAIVLQLTVIWGAPLFPSTDGPVHLYYVEVIRNLLDGTGPYPAFYNLRNPLPPYLFQYAATLTLEKLFAPLVAEQVLLSLYSVWFAISTRYLARSLGAGWRVASLVAVGFTLHRLVYMGFFNFCLAVPTALFLIGLWTKCAERLTLRRGVAFSLGFLVLATMHPVPLAFLLGYIGVHTVLSFIHSYRNAREHQMKQALNRCAGVLLPILLSLPVVVWVLVVSRGSTQSPIWQQAFFSRIFSLPGLWPILPMTAGWYRHAASGAFAVIVCLTAFSLVKKWRPDDFLNTKGAVILSACGLLLLYAVVPTEINGNGFFETRFVIFGFLLVTMAMALVQLLPSIERIAIVCAAGLVLLLVAPFWRINAQLSRDIEPILSATTVPEGSTGAVIADRCDITDPPIADIQFFPYLHTGVHFFRRSKAVLVGTPWTSVPMNPVSHKEEYSWNELPYCQTIPAIREWVSAAPNRRLDFLLVLTRRAEVPPAAIALGEEMGLKHVVALSERFVLLAVEPVTHRK